MKSIWNLTFFALLVLVTACNDELVPSSFSEKADVQNEQYLTIDEARKFFESSELSRAMDMDLFAFSPGDFVPDWSHAIASHDDENANVDVPLSGEKRYRVLYNEMIRGIWAVRQIDATQKMVITKNIKKNKLSKYFMTIIPQYSYFITMKKSASLFVTNNDKGTFSGWVVYSLPGIKKPFKIEIYENGSKTLGFVIPPIKGKRQIPLSLVRERVLDGMEFGVADVIRSRSGEYDDFFDWFEDEVWNNTDDGDHYEVNTDDDGNWWLEGNSGDSYEIPDDLIDDEDTSASEGDDYQQDDSCGNESETGGSENGSKKDDKIIIVEDGGQGFQVILDIYHTKCGTYLGSVNADSPGVTTFHCNVCNVDVPVRY